jgi:hypothetical protein
MLWFDEKKQFIFSKEISGIELNFYAENYQLIGYKSVMDYSSSHQNILCC